MPDFFDRLISRSSRPDGGGPGSSTVAATGPERLAGMAVARPRIPGVFERLAPSAPEHDLEAEAPAAYPESSHPSPGAAPAVPPQPRTHARLVQAPAAYPGARRETEPDKPPPAAVSALLPTAPQLVPAPAAAPAVPPIGQDGAVAVRVNPGRDSGEGPGAPAPPGPAATRVSGARTRIAQAVPARRIAATAQPGRAPADRPPHAEPPPDGPTVRIRIGRIEVKPSEPPGGHGPAKRALARPAPVLSLDRFLAGEAGER